MKIAAMFLIVLSHVLDTLSRKCPYIDNSDYVIDLTMATENVQHFTLSVLRYSGELGNSIFFICSAWFLLDIKKVNRKKLLFMAVEIWCISVLVLVVVYILRDGNINIFPLIQSLFPISCNTYWYITCYLLFCMIHPILNEIINHMTQTALLKAVTVLLILYVGFNFIMEGFFFQSNLILWVTIYFAIAYMKLYLKDFAASIKMNVFLVSAALAGHVGIIFITNFLELQLNLGFLKDGLLYWNVTCNPFLILLSFGLMNLLYKVNWHSTFINRISGLSMLVYIIHDNVIFKTYYRPYLIKYIYEKFGYQYIVLWVLLLAFIIFVISVLISILYEHTLQKLVKVISEKVYVNICKCYRIYEKLMLKMH